MVIANINRAKHGVYIIKRSHDSFWESNCLYYLVESEGGKGIIDKGKGKGKKNVRSKENHSAKTDFEKQN